MMGISAKIIYRQLFKTLRILTVPLQYILFLMKFLVNNLEYFLFNNTIHTKFTRNRMCLHVPATNFSLCQRGIYYTSVKIFNKLPKIYSWLNRKQEAVYSKTVKFIYRTITFYFGNESLNCSYNTQRNHYVQYIHVTDDYCRYSVTKN